MKRVLPLFGQLLLVAAVGIGALAVGRRTVLSPDRGSAPHTDAQLMNTVEWTRAPTPMWANDLKWPTEEEAENDHPANQGILIVRAQDCLTCIDLGRRLRTYLRNPEPDIKVVTSSEDSASVAGFLHREKIDPTFLSIVRPQDGHGFGVGITPPALVVPLHGTDSIDVIYLKWTVVDTASFRGPLLRRP